MFLYGVPGSGKTFMSVKLGKKLGIKVIEADKFRKILQKSITQADDPFLYSSTCKAYQLLGDLNKENVINGLLKVRKSLTEFVSTQAYISDNFVMEGAFLDPNLLIHIGKPILIVTKDEETHKRRFLMHREKLLDIYQNEFRAARIVQEHLIKEANKLRVEIMDSKLV
jgi:2-phosphoglycerate kinase